MYYSTHTHKNRGQSRFQWGICSFRNNNKNYNNVCIIIWMCESSWSLKKWNNRNIRRVKNKSVVKVGKQLLYCLFVFVLNHHWWCALLTFWSIWEPEDASTTTYLYLSSFEMVYHLYRDFRMRKLVLFFIRFNYELKDCCFFCYKIIKVNIVIGHDKKIQIFFLHSSWRQLSYQYLKHMRYRLWYTLRCHLCHNYNITY